MLSFIKVRFVFIFPDAKHSLTKTLQNALRSSLDAFLYLTSVLHSQTCRHPLTPSVFHINTITEGIAFKIATWLVMIWRQPDKSDDNVSGTITFPEYQPATPYKKFEHYNCCAVMILKFFYNTVWLIGWYLIKTSSAKRTPSIILSCNSTFKMKRRNSGHPWTWDSHH